MNAFDKAKLALRRHLAENKDKVVRDLTEMRNKSDGNDLFNYIEHFSKSMDFSNVCVSREITYKYTFVSIDSYNFIISETSELFKSPPDSQKAKIFKDLETSRSSFFRNIATC